MKIKSILATALAVSLLSGGAMAATYDLDMKGQHAFIQFKVSHLGFSWLLGRFNEFDGSFVYDEDEPSSAQAEVSIDMASVDTDHAKRDKHLRSDDFFEVSKFPSAQFVSTSFEETGNGEATLTGDLTIKGITKPVTLDVQHVGHGEDPWGGYRRGFEAKTTFTLGDFNLSPAGVLPESLPVELYISVEGIRQ